MTAPSPDAGAVVRVVFGALRRLDRTAHTQQAFQFAAAAEGLTVEQVGPAIDEAMRAATGKDRAALPYMTSDDQRQVLRATGSHLTKQAAEDTQVGPA